MKTEFDIKMTVGGMYRFLMYHAYHSFAGIFSIVAGLALIGFYIWNGGGFELRNLWNLVFGVLFLLYEPITLHSQAVKHVKLNFVYKHPLHYTLSEEGIAVRQAKLQGGMDAEQYVESLMGPKPTVAAWDSVLLVRENAKSILVYTGKKNACIWFKDQLGAQETEIREILKKYVPADKLKLRA